MGPFWAANAKLAGRWGERTVRLVLDTGATHTTIPLEIAESIGHRARRLQALRVLTASGRLVLPRLRVERFSCLGRTIRAFPVAVLTLPPGRPVDGTLGMDFLRRVHAWIDLKTGIVRTWPGR